MQVLNVNPALPLQPIFSHLGLYVKSLPEMERFYCDVLGFYVTDRLGEGDQEMVFLSRSLQEHHQIVLAPGRADGSASTVNQISFEIETLRGLIDAFQSQSWWTSSKPRSRPDTADIADAGLTVSVANVRLPGSARSQECWK